MLPRQTNRTFSAIDSAPQSRTIFACFRTIVHFYVFYGQEANKLAYCIKSAFDVSIQRRRCAFRVIQRIRPVTALMAS
jgi:hypothetical protein